MRDDYKIDVNEKVHTQLRAVAERMLDDALALAEKPGEPEEAVHDMRKRLKKLRALVRLMEHSLNGRDYRQQNVRLRDLGHQLEDIRSAQAQLACLDMLSQNFEKPIKGSAFKGLRQVLVDELEVERARFDPGRWEVIGEGLVAAKEQLSTWPTKGKGFDAIAASVKKTYKKGFSASQSAKECPEPEQLHELRKQAKNLRYQLQLLQNMWPRTLKATAKSLHELTDMLGEVRDLHLLNIWLVEKSGRSSVNPRGCC